MAATYRILDVLEEKRSKIICIDELDKMPKQFQDTWYKHPSWRCINIISAREFSEGVQVSAPQLISAYTTIIPYPIYFFYLGKSSLEHNILYSHSSDEYY